MQLNRHGESRNFWMTMPVGRKFFRPTAFLTNCRVVAPFTSKIPADKICFLALKVVNDFFFFQKLHRAVNGGVIKSRLFFQLLE